ncbi:MAG: flagellar basal body-associated FliL family protein, partial [Lachnospiraceae bacterium]|nr:flagellar basal body-associated FliL family protein [Lachnospiraceae bacterium]
NSIPMSQIETYAVPDAMTINLKAEPGDGGTYFVKLSVSVSMDKKHDDYKEYGEEISTRESIIKDTINTVISQYTVTEFDADRQAVKDDILDELQRQFGSDFIIAVNFSEVTVMEQ